MKNYGTQGLYLFYLAKKISPTIGQWYYNRMIHLNLALLKCARVLTNY